MNSEQAKAAAEVMATVWEGEFPATCQVLAAVKNDNRDYKPDAKSRIAWELATHLATADIWFIDSIVNGTFEWNPDAAKQAEAQFKSVNDIVEFYKKTFPEKLKALRALPADKLTPNDQLLRHVQLAGGAVHRLRQQPQHPSPRPARRVSARDGLEGAEHLRSERRRRRRLSQLSFPISARSSTSFAVTTTLSRSKRRSILISRWRRFTAA